MTLLPIVGRELRAAARKRSTFWLRVTVALVGLVIGAGFLILCSVSGVNPVSLGKWLFGALTWISLAVALSAGVFFTSDCLSEEKREGTLGFLFLTDLRGYDVVLGKLFATSLRGGYALLAVFPVLAVTLLMGGVTGAQFWKTVLALVNALFFSLAAGLFVSAVSRDSQKALGATLFLLVLLAGGGPIGDAAVAAVKARGFIPVLSLSSPGYVFMAANSWGASPFWRALLGSQIVAWLMLGSACLAVPRTWQERKRKAATSRAGWAQYLKYGGADYRGNLRRKLIEPNPVVWLACRERWQSFTVWAIAILVLGAFIALSASDLPTTVWVVWSYVTSVLTLALYLGTASQACRFFVDARRDGLMELLLAAPLTVPEIVRGQWRGLLWLFALPVGLFLGLEVCAVTLSQAESWRRVSASAGSATLMTGMVGSTLMIGLAVTTVVVTAANLIALSWFAMWMGLTSISANLATLKTLIFVQVIPWFLITFTSSLLIGLVMVPWMIKGTASAPARMMVWFPLLSTALNAGLSLTKDVLFSLWARRRLYSTFREQALRSVVPIRFEAPPFLPRPVSMPPVTSPRC